MNVDWNGEEWIMALDVPLNFLFKLGGETNQIIATSLGTLQYWWYGKLVEKGGLTLNSNAWDGLSALATTLIGTLYFGEELTPKQLIGSGLIIAGLILL